MEQGVLSREMQGLASRYQVLIVSEVIAYWYWLVSLLGTGDMRVYIASTILRRNYFGLKNIDINQYDTMFGVMKDVLDSLWDAGLCVLQGTCEFVLEYPTRLFMESLDISILGVSSERQSKVSKMLEITH